MAYLSAKNGDEKAYKGRRDLTPKMLSFINAYLGAAQYNAQEAIKLSDYQCKSKYSIARTAIELMDHPAIQAEIKRRLEKREKQSEIRAEYLINKLVEIIDDLEGLEKTADRLRAIELAGKAIALWKERQEVTGADGGAIQHEQHIKESVADFTSRTSSLSQRTGTDNVVKFPDGRGEGGT